MKKKQGISLIVLSITILVMAILAATAIIALEDSGIIGRSKNTVSKQNQQEEYTRLMVIKNGILTDNLGTITVDEYIAELRDKGLIENTIITNDDDSKTITTKTGFEITISQSTTSDLTLEFKSDNDQTSEDNTTPTLISFTVAGYEYQAEEGMTWIEWANSKYNEGGNYEGGGSGFGAVEYRVANAAGVPLLNVLGTDVIIANYAYVYDTSGFD